MQTLNIALVWLYIFALSCWSGLFPYVSEKVIEFLVNRYDCNLFCELLLLNQ
jgi:hypothetical protein